MLDAAEFLGRDQAVLFHGSAFRVVSPRYGKGNPNNDYGLGFYTTESSELASEWACPEDGRDGWTNRYVLNAKGLRLLDLSGGDFNVLNWMAVLLEHRKVNVGMGFGGQAREFLIENYRVDLSKADVVHGYRADDSYFYLARSFLTNRITVEVLEQSLVLGELGHQIMLRSKKAFSRLSFVSAEVAPCMLWHPRRVQRDEQARSAARLLGEEAAARMDGAYMADIMRSDSWGR